MEYPDGRPVWPPGAVRLVHLALLALAATLPFAIDPVYQRPSVSQTCYVELAGLTIGMLALAMILALRLPVRAPTRIFWIYLAWLAMIGVSILAGPVRGYGLAIAILPLTGATVLFALEAMPASLRRQESVLLLLTGIGFIGAAYGILQNFGVELFPGIAGSERQVLSSFFGHSNFMASFLAPILFLAGHFLEPRRSGRLRAAAGAAIAATLVCLFWAGTRAATLAIIVGALGLVRWRLPHGTLNRRRLATLGTIVMILAVAATLWGQYGGRHRETLLRRLSSHRELSNRAFLWLVSLEMIRDKPLSGIGYGRYNAEFWPYCERYIQRPGHEMFTYILREMRGLNPGHAHNGLLEAACETGVPGTLIYLALWVMAFVCCHRCVRGGAPADQRLARHLRAALICVFVDSLFGFPLQLPASALLFWILLGNVAQTYRRAAAADVALAAHAPVAAGRLSACEKAGLGCNTDAPRAASQAASLHRLTASATSQANSLRHGGGG